MTDKEREARRALYTRIKKEVWKAKGARALNPYMSSTAEAALYNKLCDDYDREQHNKQRFDNA